MQSPVSILARLAWLCVVLTVSSAQSGAQTHCIGFVNVAIEPSPDGQTYAVTQLSCPLEPTIVITGAGAASITGLTADSLSCSGAGWLPGELTTAPFYAKISGGPASARHRAASFPSPPIPNPR